MSWIIKRLFSDKNLGYIIEKARPMLRIAMAEEIKESITKAFQDPEFIEVVNSVGDAYYERYRRKFFGSMGGLQKGLNSEVSKIPGDFDFFDKEGRLSIKKILPKLLSGGIAGFKLGGSNTNQAQNTRGSGKGSQEAPQM